MDKMKSFFIIDSNINVSGVQNIKVSEVQKQEVEELRINKSPNFGLIEYNKTINAFFPSGYFQTSTYKDFNTLYKFTILTDKIPINKYFYIIDLIERVDSNTSRNYYRELLITVIDSQGNTRDFKFHKEPDNKPFSAYELEKYFNELKELFGNDKIFYYLDERIRKLMRGV